MRIKITYPKEQSFWQKKIALKRAIAFLAEPQEIDFEDPGLEIQLEVSLFEKLKWLTYEAFPDFTNNGWFEVDELTVEQLAVMAMLQRAGQSLEVMLWPNGEEDGSPLLAKIPLIEPAIIPEWWDGVENALLLYNSLLEKGERNGI